MKKNKLFVVLAVVTILTFLGTAATCNLCGLVPPVETTSEESEEEVSGGQRTETTTAKTEVEETEPTEEEAPPEEAPPEEAPPEEAPPEEAPPEEAPPEEEAPPVGDAGDSATVFDCALKRNLSGYVNEDGSVLTRTIWVGDDASNNCIKGYLSFDISELSTASILDATLRISGIVGAVDPTFADNLIIKVYDFGSSLGPEDFTTGGDHLATISTAGLTSINISSSNLKTLLSRKIGEGKDYFQLKIGLNVYSDDDGVADLFDLSNAELSVTQ